MKKLQVDAMHIYIPRGLLPHGYFMYSYVFIFMRFTFHTLEVTTVKRKKRNEGSYRLDHSNKTECVYTCGNPQKVVGVSVRCAP